jgi:hypothetical protein
LMAFRTRSRDFIELIPLLSGLAKRLPRSAGKEFKFVSGCSLADYPFVGSRTVLSSRA